MPGSPTFRLHLRRDSRLDQPSAIAGHEANTRLQGNLPAHRVSGGDLLCSNAQHARRGSGKALPQASLPRVPSRSETGPARC